MVLRKRNSDVTAVMFIKLNAMSVYLLIKTLFVRYISRTACLTASRDLDLCLPLVDLNSNYPE